MSDIEKSIVVGIDFSRSSIQAFEYALGIAGQTQSNLKLVYVTKKRDIDSLVPRDGKGKNSATEKSFEKLIARYKDTIPGEITYRILSGKIYEEVTNLAKYTEAWLIIAGAHGMSGFEEMWVGNNASKIISHANRPVITLKKNFRIKKPVMEKIVLPIDSTFETIQKVPFTLELAQYFKAQINVLSLYSSKMKTTEQRVENNTRDVMELIVKSGLRYINEKIVDENITRATIEYAQKRNADLISIMTEQEFSSQNVLMGTYAQQMVNQAPIPVLSHKTRILIKHDALIE